MQMGIMRVKIWVWAQLCWMQFYWVILTHFTQSQAKPKLCFHNTFFNHLFPARNSITGIKIYVWAPLHWMQLHWAQIHWMQFHWARLHWMQSHWAQSYWAQLHWMQFHWGQHNFKKIISILPFWSSFFA